MYIMLAAMSCIQTHKYRGKGHVKKIAKTTKLSKQLKIIGFLPVIYNQALALTNKNQYTY